MPDTLDQKVIAKESFLTKKIRINHVNELIKTLAGL